MTDSIEGWVTTAQAAELTGYNVKYLRQLVRDGRIEARKVGRDWLVNLEDVLSYKARMDALGSQKHNPWRDDLADQGRGREVSSNRDADSRQYYQEVIWTTKTWRTWRKR
jgi:excisionase family DNA binding protein